MHGAEHATRLERVNEAWQERADRVIGMSLKQRLAPLLASGDRACSGSSLLVLVPMYFMGRTGAALGLADTGSHLRLGLVELPRLPLRPRPADHPVLLLRRDRDAAGSADLLPARLCDRLPRRPLQTAAALRGESRRSSPPT
jgi:hypothetical protein